MRTFKAFVAAITLLAVGVNPLAAGLMPCCMVTEAQTAPACGQNAAGHKCCKKHPICCKKQLVAMDSPLTLGCCCVKVPPASTPPSDNTQKLPAQQQVLALGSSTFIVAEPSQAAHALPFAHDGLALSGPPLLALYCIWLK
jgi:hypothetical protein